MADEPRPSPRQEIVGRIPQEEQEDRSGAVTSDPAAELRSVTEAAASADQAPAGAGEIAPLAGLLALRPALGLFAYAAASEHTHTHGAAAFAEHRRQHPRLHAFSYAVDAVFRISATVLLLAGGAAVVWKIVFGRV